MIVASESIGLCWRCGQGLTAADYGREASCPGCGKNTRVCRNCRHYAPGRPNDCLEPLAERVLIKDRANFCDHFEPSVRPLPGAGPGETVGRDHQDALRAAAEALFRK